MRWWLPLLLHHAAGTQVPAASTYSVSCIPVSAASFDPETQQCFGQSFQPSRVDGSLHGWVNCWRPDQEACNTTSLTTIGATNHIDVSCVGPSGCGIRDWVHIVSIVAMVHWATAMIVGCIMFSRWDRGAAESDGKAIELATVGIKRQMVSLALPLSWLCAAWAFPRQQGWFVLPFCGLPGDDPLRKGTAYWFFILGGPLQVFLALTSTLSQMTNLFKALHSPDVVIVHRRQLLRFVAAVQRSTPVWIAAQKLCTDRVPFYLWERNPELQLQPEQVEELLALNPLTRVTFEVHIVPVDNFSEGSLEAVGCLFALEVDRTQAEQQGRILIFRQLVETSKCCDETPFVSSVLPIWLMNSVMFGLAHTAWLWIKGTGNVTFRIEQRIRILPDQELITLKGGVDSANSLRGVARLQDWRLRALDQAAQLPWTQDEAEDVEIEPLGMLDALTPMGPRPSHNQQEDFDGSSLSDGVQPHLEAARAARLEAQMEARIQDTPWHGVARRFREKCATRKDWESLIGEAELWLIKSWTDFVDRELNFLTGIEEAMELFVTGWRARRLKPNDMRFQDLWFRLRIEFAQEFRQALAALDFERIDRLKALADQCPLQPATSTRPCARLLDSSLSDLLSWHGRHMLDLAVKMGDRKALALALIESARLCGDDFQPSSNGRVAVGDTSLYFHRAREMYREQLYKDTQQVLMTEAGKELLGDGRDFFGETWVQKQLCTMRIPRAGQLDPRSKNEVESPDFLRSIQALFDLSSRKVITRDRRGELPSQLKVVKVKRSVNLDAYRAYYARRSEICSAPAPLQLPAGGNGTAGHVEDCLTNSFTGCWIERSIRRAQGIWLEKGKGVRYIVMGDLVVEAASLGAEALSPAHGGKIRAARDSTLTSPAAAAEGSPQPDLLWSPRGTPMQAQFGEGDRTLTWTLAPRGPTPGMVVIDMQESPREEVRTWVKDPGLLGHWLVNGKEVLILPEAQWVQAADYLDRLVRQQTIREKMRLPAFSAVSPRGRAWLAAELEQMLLEAYSSGEDVQPPLMLHLGDQLYPIWPEASTSEENDRWNFRSITFRGYADKDGKELFIEPSRINFGSSGSQLRSPRAFSSASNGFSGILPSPNAARMQTAQLQRLKEPFRQRIWGYRKHLVVDLSSKELHRGANELWLFHGTREAAAESITDNEFQLRLAGTHRGTMFGPGIYLADSVTKSDEYTEPDINGLRTIMICRTTMGRILEQRDGGRTCMRLCQSLGYHSVKGLRAFNEYIVYDENQVYPEYIVWYRRIYNK